MNPQQPSSKHSLATNLTRFWGFILRLESGRVIWLLFIMCLAAVMEMLTLAAAVPLVSSMVNAGNPDANTLFQGLAVPVWLAESVHLPAVILGGIVVIVCVAALLRVLVVRMTAEFSAHMGLKLQTLYLRQLLNREYQAVVNQSSSDNVSLMSNKLQFIIAHYLLGVLTTTTALVSTVGIVAMLIWLSTSVVMVALAFLALMYAVIAIFTRRRLKFYGGHVATYNPQTIRCLQDGLGGIRDVIMSQSQEVFVERLSNVAGKVESAKAKLVFYGGFPRPLLEALGISSIAVIAYLVNKGTLGGANLLPMLGAFSLGMLRLLPYLQQIFSHWSKLFHGQFLLDELMVAMNDFEGINSSNLQAASGTENSQDLAFEHSIDLQAVSFTYESADRAVLQDVNLEIKKGEHVGIVGQTGSGKSTLVDIIMGLLEPGKGHLRVDNTVISDTNRKIWRSKVAHVPQRIYLTDGSITQNIAFAVPTEKIDIERVKECAKQAFIHDYIVSLTKEYQTQVGENGVRLSGGQRQRLGIARALYANCEVLVFDEATNALDKDTEAALIDGLLKIDKTYTIIAVAHNLEAVRHCHRRIELADGKATLQRL